MSDAGNRDDSLERLLRKAKPMLGGNSTPEACLDAETVAAWAGGGLAGDELERAQLHTAGCTRCQALVAVMVRIDPAEVTDEVPAPSSRAWIGWLVPLTAAAGLTLFFVTRGPGSVPTSIPMVRPADEVALSAPSAGGAASAPTPAPPSADREASANVAGAAAGPQSARQSANQQASEPGARLADVAAAGAADAAQADRSRSAGNRAAPTEVSPARQTMGGVAGGIAATPPAGATTPAQPKAAVAAPTPPATQMAVQQQSQMTSVQSPTAATAMPTGPLPGTLGQASAATATLSPPPAAPPPPPPPPVAAMAESVIVAAPPSSAQAREFGAAGAGGRAGGGAGRGGGRGGTANIALDGISAVEIGTVVVAPPDSTVRWRSTGALVERSTNAGATWQFVARVVDANFRAASSPSPLVCWFVGRDGVVVVFTEGRTARAVTFPEMVHLTSVRATDERTATVRTTNGREFQHQRWRPELEMIDATPWR